MSEVKPKLTLLAYYVEDDPAKARARKHEMRELYGTWDKLKNVTIKSFKRTVSADGVDMPVWVVIVRGEQKDK